VQLQFFPQCCAKPVVQPVPEFAPVPALAPPPASVSPPPAPVPPPEPMKEKITINLNVEFNTANAVVKDKYYHEIKGVAYFMKQYPDSKGEIAGYTDNIAGDAYNQKLSEKRAKSVRQYLIDKFEMVPVLPRLVTARPNLLPATIPIKEGRKTEELKLF